MGDVLEHAALLDAGRLLAALELDRHRGLDLLVQPHLEQVDVHHLVADRVELLVLDDHRTASLPPDLEVDQRRAVDQHLAQLAGATLNDTQSSVGAAVDDAGHEARLGAGAAWRGSRARGAPRRSSVGRLGVSHTARQCSERATLSACPSS